MANKRKLKKSIRFICGDIAGECFLASRFVPNADKEKLNKAIVDIAQLQEDTLAHTSFSFDKTPRDFESKREYNKAKHTYYATAFRKLIDHFNESLKNTVHLMNEAMPSEQKEANKEK